MSWGDLAAIVEEDIDVETAAFRRLAGRSRPERTKVFRVGGVPPEDLRRFRLKLPPKRGRHTAHHAASGVGQTREPQRRDREMGYAPQVEPERSPLSKFGGLLGGKGNQPFPLGCMRPRLTRCVGNDRPKGGFGRCESYRTGDGERIADVKVTAGLCRMLAFREGTPHEVPHSEGRRDQAFSA
jgi:hypothetical protein